MVKSKFSHKQTQPTEISFNIFTALYLFAALPLSNRRTTLAPIAKCDCDVQI